jgi:hypothetical protein
MIEHPGERPQERPRLEPDRFAQYVEYLGLSYREASRLWNMDPRRIRRMATGEEPVPFTLEIMLQNAAALQILLAMVTKHFDEQGTRPVGFLPVQESAEAALERARGPYRKSHGQVTHQGNADEDP